MSIFKLAMPLLVLLFFLLAAHTERAHAVSMEAPTTATRSLTQNPPPVAISKSLVNFIENPLLPGLHRQRNLDPGTHVLAGYEFTLLQLIIQPHPKTLEVIRNLVLQLPHRVETILLVSSQKEAERTYQWLHVMHLVPQCPVRVIVAPSVFPYSAWARDSYISLAAPGHRLIFARPAGPETYLEHSRGDAYSPVAVARIAGGFLYDSKIYFEGGNVRIGLRPDGQRDVFVNTRFIRLNQQRHLSIDKIRAEAQTLFGQSVQVLPEVDPHLDTYLTFAPHGEALVGDSSLALRLMARSSGAASREAARKIQKYGYASKLNLIAKKLRDLGYHVDRLPWLPEPPIQTTQLFLTYNNGLFLDPQTYVMPLYDLPTDALAVHILEGAGLHVQTVNVRSMSWGGGTLHCITQEGARVGFVMMDPLSMHETTIGRVSVSEIIPKLCAKKRAYITRILQQTQDPNPAVARASQHDLEQWRTKMEGRVGVEIDLPTAQTAPPGRPHDNFLARIFHD